MTHWAPAHDKSVRCQLTVKILEFLPEGSGTGFLHKKRVPETSPLPLLASVGGPLLVR